MYVWLIYFMSKLKKYKYSENNNTIKNGKGEKADFIIPLIAGKIFSHGNIMKLFLSMKIILFYFISNRYKISIFLQN